jgi:hypothetical protein
VTDAGNLEDRVAALEALVMPPAGGLDLTQGWPAWTEQQIAEFTESFASAAGARMRILPHIPPFTEDEIRQLLRECVTVVRPGETLVIRLASGWTPGLAREMADEVREVVKSGNLGFSVLVVRGDEMGVAEAAGA